MESTLALNAACATFSSNLLLLFCTNVWDGSNSTERIKGAEDEILFGSSAFVRCKSDYSTVRRPSCNSDNSINIKTNSGVTSIYGRLEISLVMTMCRGRKISFRFSKSNFNSIKIYVI